MGYDVSIVPDTAIRVISHYLDQSGCHIINAAIKREYNPYKKCIS